VSAFNKVYHEHFLLRTFCLPPKKVAGVGSTSSFKKVVPRNATFHNTRYKQLPAGALAKAGSFAYLSGNRIS